MTAASGSPTTVAGMPVAARWRSALATEWHIQSRSGIPVGAAVTTAGWVVLLRIVPVAARSTAAAWVLFFEVTALGFFAAPSLAVVERATGVVAATALTLWRVGAAVTIRMSLLAAWASASALAITAAGGLEGAGAVLVGVLGATGLLTFLSLAALGQADTLTAWMPRVPLVAVPVLVPAMVAAAGISDHPALALSPLTGAWRWWTGTPSGGTLAWLLAWSAAAAWWVVRAGWVVSSPGETTAAMVEPTAGWLEPGGPAAGPWRRRVVAIRSQARVDRRTLGGDALVAMLLGGVPVVAIAVRVATRPLLAWVETRWGVDLAPHLPALWAFLLVVHTTVMFGSTTGLLLLEDRDAGLEPATAITPAGSTTVLAWRLGATAAVTGVAVALALVVGSARPAAGLVGLVGTAVAAAITSAVPALLLAALARDRAAGMVVMKALSLPLYVPVLWWVVDGPAGWLFGVVPTAWAARALWATTPAGVVAAVAGATVTTVVVAAAALTHQHQSIGTR